MGSAVPPTPLLVAGGLVPLDVVQDRAAVLVDGHHLAAATVLARAARRRGVPVVLDGGSWKPGPGELLREVDDAVLSADFVLPGTGVGQDRSVPDTPGLRSTGPDGVDRTLDGVVAWLGQEAAGSAFLASMDLPARVRLVPAGIPVGALGAALAVGGEH